MSNLNILAHLENYRSVWLENDHLLSSETLSYKSLDHKAEFKAYASIRDFAKNELRCFERSCEKGHITGSAMVCNRSMTRVVLMLHSKLNKWLQLGGHADGNPDIAAVALQEASEESGRDDVHFFPWEKLFGAHLETPIPFDLDVHEIPSRKNEAEHLHFDVRFLVMLDDTLPLHPNAESKALKWLNLDEAMELTDEESMQRQFRKLIALKKFATVSNLQIPSIHSLNIEQTVRIDRQFIMPQLFALTRPAAIA